MVQGRGGLGLLQEPLLGRVISGQVRWQELDRDRALQAGVTGLVDHAHAAAAKLGDDLVGPELGASC